jgi:putative acetyltransferase
MEDIVIRPAESLGDVATVQELWREYWRSFELPDYFQGFRQELDGLPGVYGQRGGALLVAWEGEQPAGTIALRRLNDLSGEVKRLYLRTDFRGRRLGWRLLEAVIERAIAIKYHSLYADTLPNMVEALSLYEKLGFERVEAYSNTPTPCAIFLRKQLVVPRAGESRDSL